MVGDVPAGRAAILSGALIGFVNAIALFGSQAIIGLPARIFTLPTRIYALFDYRRSTDLPPRSRWSLSRSPCGAVLQRSYLARRSYVTLRGRAPGRNVSRSGHCVGRCLHFVC